MQTIFTCTGLLVKIQMWLDGDSNLTLRQLNELYLRIEELLIWSTGPAQAAHVRRIHDELDAAYAAILQAVA